MNTRFALESRRHFDAMPIMRKFTLGLAAFLWALSLQAQDLVSGGSNAWIFHTPDTGVVKLHIAPYLNGDWAWDRQSVFLESGDLELSGALIAPSFRLKSWVGTPNSTLNDINYSAITFYNLGSYPVAEIKALQPPGTWPDGAALVFYSSFGSLQERMRITPHGNVGIGVTNPGEKLHVAGSINLGNPHEAEKSIQAHSQDLRISSGWDKNLILGHTHFTPNGGKVLIPGGNVGIGTTEPSERLTVAGGRFKIHTAAEWDNLIIHTEGERSIIEANGDEKGLFLLSNVGQKVIVPYANVGIGETNPQHKLAVNGTIKAKEVIVETTGWSDYVFADDYRLAPLSEVEAHIKANKHLPGIPSAAQVAEQGVSVGDMQARLLAKLEELTLHQIALEKENRALRAEVQAIKAQLR